ncbi:hypothetical protein HY621_03030 [Candidatus Uhrbacteria bacterium]|nr:hypothetical protein [Candidatus Uhrbacteria bacterium]
MYKPFGETRAFIALAIVLALSASVPSFGQAMGVLHIAGINGFAEMSGDTCQDRDQCMTYCNSNLVGDGNPFADFCAQIFPDTFKRTACSAKEPLVCPATHPKLKSYTIYNGCVEYSCGPEIPYSQEPTAGSSQVSPECNKTDIAQSTQRIKSQMLQPIQAQLGRIARQGVSIPQDVTQDMQTWANLLQQLKQTNDCDAVLTISPALDTVMRGLDEKLQKVSRLAGLPQGKKRLINELNRVEKDWGRSRKSAARLAASSELIGRGDDILQQMKALRATTLAAMDEGIQGSVDAVAQVEQGGEQLLAFRDQLQNVTITLDALVNAKRQVKTLERQYREALASIKKYKRIGADIQELAACAADLKTALAAARTVAVARPVDYAAIAQAFLNAEEVSGRCQSLTQSLSGISSFDALIGQVRQLFKPLAVPNLSQPDLGRSSESNPVEGIAPIPRLYR